jgi:two-component system sensor histidine kinase RegB
VLTLDTLVLSALLHETGGSANPFSVLYLVHITLAAMLLGAAWTWALTLLAVVAYGSLFFADEHAQHFGHEYVTHLRGMWFAFALTAMLTAAFVVRLTGAIQRRDREIEAIRAQAARSERLAGLTTLAAARSRPSPWPRASSRGRCRRCRPRTPSASSTMHASSARSSIGAGTSSTR